MSFSKEESPIVSKLRFALALVVAEGWAATREALTQTSERSEGARIDPRLAICNVVPDVHPNRKSAVWGWVRKFC